MATLRARVLLTGTAFLGFASVANAQDADWSGFYGGVHTGRDWSDANWASSTDQVNQVSGINVPASATGGARGLVTVAPTTVVNPRTSASDDKATWGGQIGWAHQSGPWVFGLEGDVDAGHGMGSATSTVPLHDTLLEQTHGITINRSIESRWSWSARGRVGYAWDRWQIYATGGVAGADLRISGTDAYQGGGAGMRGCFNPDNTPCYSLTNIFPLFTNTTSGSQTKHRIGWTVGGGLDFALGHGFSLGIEARHTDYGHQTVSLPASLSQSGPYVNLNVLGGASGPVTPTGLVAQAIPHQTPIGLRDNQVSLRLNMHFGGLKQSDGHDGGMGSSSGPYNWTAFYVGLHVGDNWRRATPDPFNTAVANSTNAFIPGRGIVVVPGTTVPGPDATLKSNREIWGAQAGYAHQWGNWVLGLEADISGPAKVGTDSVSTLMPLTAISASVLATDSRTVESRWSWAALARVGFAWDRLQFYGAGGVAGASLRVSGRGVFNNPGGDAAFACVPPGTACSPQTTNGPFVVTNTSSVSRNRIGWVAGGGVEWALLDGLSLALDYRHTDLGKATYTLTNNAGTPPAVYTAPVGATPGQAGQVFLGATTYRYSDNAVTLRVNLRIGRSGGR